MLLPPDLHRFSTEASPACPEARRKRASGTKILPKKQRPSIGTVFAALQHTGPRVDRMKLAKGRPLAPAMMAAMGNRTA